MSSQINDQFSYRYFYLWWLFGLTMIILVIYLSLTSVPVVNIDVRFVDKLEHLLAYGVLMGWYSQFYVSTNSRIIWAIIFCLMGMSLEVMQAWGGVRYFEYADMMANTTGVFLGWWLSSRFAAGWLARVDRAISK